MPDETVPSTPNRSAVNFRIPFDDDRAVERISGALDAVFEDTLGRPVVVVCVGTDRSTGDAFGPIIGSRLAAQGLKGLEVFGTLNEPVHAVNLSSTLQQIYRGRRTKPFILAVDACLGQFDHVGHIIIEQGPLRPGAGVKKSLPEFGDYTLTGVVNVCGFMEYFVLQNTRLGIVMRMSEVVVEAVSMSWRRLQVRRSFAGAPSPV
ncbi:MAG: spore protease YyaC [Alicyclobacillus sp.]|nr:spore protease YyaC [Alicyclobacillus sp.]